MAAPSTAYFIAELDDGFGDVYPLQRGVTFGIGRSPKNRIVLADDLSSRDHAELAFAEGDWYARDLGSTNGTKVNGKVIRGEQALKSGDRLQMGNSRFRFVDDLADLPGIPEAPARALEEAIRITKRTTKTRFLPGNNDDTVDGRTVKVAGPDRALAALYRLALDMGAARSIEDLANAVLAGLFEGFEADYGAVMAVLPRDLELVAHKSRDGKPSTYHKASQLVSTTVLDTREAVLADNLQQSPKFAKRDSIVELKAVSLICVPVLEGDAVLGLIHLYAASPKQFDEDDLEYTLAVAQQMAGAWSQLRRQDVLSNTNRALQAVLRLESELVGESAALKHIEGQISRVAGTSATVLIRGESGSGKELVARAIHNTSPRKDGPFITLNCAAITESLLESELFGHERGAFTGATEKMMGKFEAADRGTIFLDEIGEMPASTQSKFLRVLEGHPFERLGGNNRIQVDVRVVAATNRPLEQAVRDGTFRKDLFYRLQVVEIKVPPLRDRLDDVPALADHFLKKFARETGRRFKGLTPDATDKLKGYHWPGNVRELRNVIERAVALNDKAYLDAGDLWLTSFDPAGSGVYPPVYKVQSLEEVEKRHIRETLKHTDWNKSRAAEILQIERSTLDRKIKAYDLRKDG
ncbi:MAG TPA: sigma 54-interacting transcriptional regulator [Gemmataceae bacterium]|jgi:Nif-specific regulatory protein|nr:sigma 54-interacting transcriptional regulator [Gemmataceae bacterium]